MWRGEREGGHRVERLGERREVLHPYRWSAVRHRGRRVHRGHDVQQVRDVAAVAPSEEVWVAHATARWAWSLSSTGTRTTRGAEDATPSTDGAALGGPLGWSQKSTAGMRRERRGGARVEVWRCSVRRVERTPPLQPDHSHPPSRQLFSFFSELVSGHENIEPSARRWTKPAPPALKTPRSRVMPNPTATFNTSEVRSRHA